MKDLLFTMLNLSTLNQVLHKLFVVTIGSLDIDKKGLMNQHQQHKGVLHHQQQKGFSTYNANPTLATYSKEDPMHIDKTILKPLMEQKKQCQHTYKQSREPSHVICECPKKHGLHVTCAISITNL